MKEERPAKPIFDKVNIKLSDDTTKTEKCGNNLVVWGSERPGKLKSYQESTDTSLYIHTTQF